MPKFKWLRGLGPIGNFLANALTFLTANWGLAMSAAFAVFAGAFDAVRTFVTSPPVYVAVGVFLALLWTIIGVLALIDRRRPRVVRPYRDYEYGLLFEGLQPHFVPENSWQPEPGALQFSIHLRNFSQAPIRYSLESIDIRIGSRTIPRYQANSVSSMLGRGAGRQTRAAGFPSGSLKEFYGKGLTEGTVEFSILYGPPDGPPVRRFKMGLDMWLVFPEGGQPKPADGIALGYSDSITSESDEPIEGV